MMRKFWTSLFSRREISVDKLYEFDEKSKQEG